MRILSTACLLLAAVSLFAQNPDAKQVTLPNGWRLWPAGRALPLGDLPLNMALSPSQKTIAITNAVNNQTTTWVFTYQ